jgi:uncharacterized repeat protein (TIGR03803 family)
MAAGAGWPGCASSDDLMLGRKMHIGFDQTTLIIMIKKIEECAGFQIKVLGRSILPFGMIFKIWSLTAAVSFEELHSFDDTAPGSDSGYSPVSVIQASDGNLYGTTRFGGANQKGTIFKTTLDGAFSTLLSFNGTNGAQPEAGLTEGTDGNFYGTTRGGGRNDVGTAFRLTPQGELTTLLSLSAGSTLRVSGLLLAKDGNFYGTSLGVLGAFAGEYVFKMTPNGKLTQFHLFDRASGVHALNGLVQGRDGNFYGTCGSGPSTNLGMVFRLAPDGTATELAYFNGANGNGPVGALVERDDGSFYGATGFGGPDNKGTVFKVTPDGTLTTLAFFSSEYSGGPYIGLFKAGDGNLYGMTFPTTYPASIPTGRINIFAINAEDRLTSIYSFPGMNGKIPDACGNNDSPSLAQGLDGNLYGITCGGGLNHAGNIFRLVFLPTLGITKAAQSVIFAWDAFAGKSYQVQYKSDLNVPNWSDLSPAITATNSTVSVTNDPAGAAQRFYRVTLPR